MSDNRAAMPGDPDLDCHLTGVRITGVADVGDPDYLEVLLTLDLSRARGWYSEDGNRHTRPGKDHDEITLAFGKTVPARYRMAAARITATLRRWRDDGTGLTLTSAPGRHMRLAGGGTSLPLPVRSAARAAP